MICCKKKPTSFYVSRLIYLDLLTRKKIFWYKRKASHENQKADYTSIDTFSEKKKRVINHFEPFLLSQHSYFSTMFSCFCLFDLETSECLYPLISIKKKLSHWDRNDHFTNFISKTLKWYRKLDSIVKASTLFAHQILFIFKFCVS